ncbi:MAG: iron ABC transporter permease [Candidatus Sumerlaeota bacterium]
MTIRQRAYAIWSLLAISLLAAIIVCPLLGSTHLDLAKVFSAEGGADAQIFFTARLPRVLFAVIAGAGLSLAGAVYQALLRNDLADPYTLGVSGGASFGALLVLHLIPATALFFALPLASFAGAGVAVAIVYALSSSRRRVDPAKLLLAGITLNLLFSSGILLIQYLSDPYQTYSMIRWMMGGVDVSAIKVPGIVAAFAAPCALVIVLQAKRMNLLTLGDMTAAHLGLDVRKTKLVLLIAASLMAAAIVAYAGPIGFIGLLVPHIARRLVGSDHRLLLVPCAMTGALLLLVCDTLARSLPPLIPKMPGSELPVGIVTAFMGAPFFLYLLLRGKRA